MTTANADILTAIRGKIANLDTAALKDMAQALMHDHRDGTLAVLRETLNGLKGRMSRQDYAAFCDTL